MDTNGAGDSFVGGKRMLRAFLKYSFLDTLFTGRAHKGTNQICLVKSRSEISSFL